MYAGNPTTAVAHLFKENVTVITIIKMSYGLNLSHKEVLFPTLKLKLKYDLCNKDTSLRSEQPSQYCMNSTGKTDEMRM